MMAHKRLRGILTVCLAAAFLLISCSREAPVAEEDFAVGDVWIKANLWALDLEAINQDLYFYVGWEFDATNGRVQMARACVDGIKDIRSKAEQLDFGSAKETRRALLALCDGFIEYCAVVEGGDTNVLRAAVPKFRDYVGAFNDALMAEHPLEDLDHDQPVPDPEGAEVDLVTYKNAVALFEAGKAAGSVKKLEGLIARLDTGSQLAAAARVALADCILHNDRGIEAGPDVDLLELEGKAIGMLAESIESRVYHPRLLEAWRKWRSATQSLHHGMSNYSDIPNGEYNAMRVIALEAVRSYCRQNPADAWARYQLVLLTVYPNIGRGAPFGNWNILESVKLFSDDPAFK